MMGSFRSILVACMAALLSCIAVAKPCQPVRPPGLSHDEVRSFTLLAVSQSLFLPLQEIKLDKTIGQQDRQYNKGVSQDQAMYEDVLEHVNDGLGVRITTVIAADPSLKRLKKPHEVITVKQLIELTARGYFSKRDAPFPDLRPGEVIETHAFSFMVPEETGWTLSTCHFSKLGFLRFNENGEFIDSMSLIAVPPPKMSAEELLKLVETPSLVILDSGAERKASRILSRDLPPGTCAQSVQVGKPRDVLGASASKNNVTAVVRLCTGPAEHLFQSAGLWMLYHQPGDSDTEKAERRAEAMFRRVVWKVGSKWVGE